MYSIIHICPIWIFYNTTPRPRFPLSSSSRRKNPVMNEIVIWDFWSPEMNVSRWFFKWHLTKIFLFVFFFGQRQNCMFHHWTLYCVLVKPSACVQFLPLDPILRHWKLKSSSCLQFLPGTFNAWLTGLFWQRYAVVLLQCFFCLRQIRL